MFLRRRSSLLLCAAAAALAADVSRERPGTGASWPRGDGRPGCGFPTVSAAPPAAGCVAAWLDVENDLAALSVRSLACRAVAAAAAKKAAAGPAKGWARATTRGRRDAGSAGAACAPSASAAVDGCTCPAAEPEDAPASSAAARSKETVAAHAARPSTRCALARGDSTILIRSLLLRGLEPAAPSRNPRGTRVRDTESGPGSVGGLGCSYASWLVDIAAGGLPAVAASCWGSRLRSASLTASSLWTPSAAQLRAPAAATAAALATERCTPWMAKLSVVNRKEAAWWRIALATGA
jgi:hypothetical protein